MSDVNDVFNIATDVFGEDNVDIQSNNILIHWDKITITNENENTHDIFDLYARIGVSVSGCYMSVELIRSTFTNDEAIAGYVHSHVMRSDERVEFDTPCFGKGPIRNTITSITQGYDEDLWRLFFVELDRFVRVESLIGVPYIRMSSVGVKSFDRYNLELMFNINENNLPAVTYHEMRNVFDYLKANNRIVPMLKSISPVSLGSMNDAVINMTRETMMYHNIEPVSDDIYHYVYCEARVNEGAIMVGGSGCNNRRISEMRTFYFKGKKVDLKIIDNDNDDKYCMTVLNESAASILLSLIANDVYINDKEYFERYNEYNREKQQSGISACAAQG